MPVTAIEATAALILIDLQKGIVGSATTPVPIETVLKNAAGLAAAFREKNMPSCSSMCRRRPRPHRLLRGARFRWAARSHGRLDRPRRQADAQPTDHRITKTRWGAFHKLCWTSA